MADATERVSVSIVSHRHGPLLAALLSDLDRHRAADIELLLTLNVPEDLSFDPAGFRFPLRVIRNPAPKGFGENHNAAFKASRHAFFCVCNPDIRLPLDPFPPLLQRLGDPRIGIVAPLVRAPDGSIESSARPFPTPLLILRKALFGPDPPDYAAGAPDCTPDWVGGMFMLFPREAFAQVDGFDERFHLYYEDVDLCARLRLAGQEVVLCPTVEVVHAARRESHRNPRFLAWHLISMLRFFVSKPFRRVVLARRQRSRSLPDRRD